MAEVVATLSHLARSSPHINQRSGVSVRLSIANYETLVANAARRALRLGEKDAVPRISDLESLVSSTAGKVEIESIDEGRDDQVVERLLKAAVLTVFKDRCPMDQFRDALAAFNEATIVHAGDDVASTDYVATLHSLPALRGPVMALAGSESPGAVASAVEFVLEERDVQVRGYKIRLPLDVMLVASANPEDYTNRGRIITPLKDRFGAQIRTHYPLDVETELGVVRQESVALDGLGVNVHVPEFMAEVVATLSHLARSSPHINQRSGVSVRLSIANYETLCANAARRSLRLGEKDAVPRISDLESLVSSTAGKVEIESIDEGRDDQVVERLLKAAVLTVFKERCPMEQFREALTAFGEATIVHAGDDVSSADYVATLQSLPALRAPVMALAGSESPGAVASAVEFVLEGLHLSKRLNKEAAGSRATYRGR
jgi:Mg-chelatase subunit ChlI